MKVTYPTLKTRKGATVDLNNLIDNNRYFRRHRDKCQRFDSSVYCIITPWGSIVYYGKGKFYLDNILKSRGCCHFGDLVDKYLTEGWIIRFISIGITDEESRALEALLIMKCDKKLTKRGAKVWDGVSLMNKRRERKWEKRINEFLIYGNNTRIAA